LAERYSPVRVRQLLILDTRPSCLGKLFHQMKVCHVRVSLAKFAVSKRCIGQF